MVPRAPGPRKRRAPPGRYLGPMASAPPPPDPGPDLELTCLMPCLDEAETLATCVEKALRGLAELGIEGEVLVADNGSTDGSQEIAAAAGARVVPVPTRGYGAALAGGIAVARGRFVIMGDADDSYDWSNLGPLVAALREGADLVMGCRLPKGGGTILPGAMPFLHRWLGNPGLSFVGRVLFGCPVTDFHCGLRGFRRNRMRELDLRTTGMEFASEMVIKATLHGLRIAEVPITLHPDGRSRPPHLRTWRDGWRHLRFMLLFAPHWLFTLPGGLAMLLGGAGFLAVLPGPLFIGGVGLDVHSMLVFAFAALLGLQLVCFGLSARVFAIREGLLPDDPWLLGILRRWTLEVGLLLGLALGAGGVALLLAAVRAWAAVDYGEFDYETGLRLVIPAVSLMAFGVQVFFTSFFLASFAPEDRPRGAPGSLPPAQGS